MSADDTAIHDPDGYFPKNLRILAGNLHRRSWHDMSEVRVYGGWVEFLRDLADRLEAPTDRWRRESEEAGARKIEDSFAEPVRTQAVVNQEWALVELRRATAALERTKEWHNRAVDRCLAIGLSERKIGAAAGVSGAAINQRKKRQLPSASDEQSDNQSGGQ